MPIYYFNIKNGFSHIDDAGTYFLNQDAARQEAIRLTVAALSKMSYEFWSGETWHLIVEDENKSELFRINFVAEMKDIHRY